MCVNLFYINFISSTGSRGTWGVPVYTALTLTLAAVPGGDDTASTLEGATWDGSVRLR